MSDLLKVAVDLGNGTEIACLPAGEEEQFVEELECRCRWLVNTGNDDNLAWILLECLRVCQTVTHVVQPCQLLRVRDDFVTGGRVQPARGFI